MYLIVGLGNPTNKYIGTRHNIGFDAVINLCDKLDISLKEQKFKSKMVKTNINGKSVIIMQPQTYMNLSGEAVREVVNFYKIPSENIIVLFDDIDINLGSIRIRTKGSAGGHNGIKNIISCIGTDKFIRVKIGVSKKPEYMDLADYVLSKFTDVENEIVRKQLSLVTDAVLEILNTNVDVAMNRFNNKNV